MLAMLESPACSCRLVLSACVARHIHVRNTCPICPKGRLLSWFHRYHGCMHDCCSSCHDTAVCVGSFHGCKHFLVQPTAASSWWSPQRHDCFCSQLTTACSPCMMLVQKLAGLVSIMVGSSITCVARHHLATITGCSSCHDTAAHGYNSCL